jgi:hypothetical protein
VADSPDIYRKQAHHLDYQRIVLHMTFCLNMLKRESEYLSVP